jgi:hypothetical protein
VSILLEAESRAREVGEEANIVKMRILNLPGF